MNMSLSIKQLLALMSKQKGSDLHLASGTIPMIRVNGILAKVEMPLLNAQAVEGLLSEVLSSEQKKKLAEEKNIDFAIKVAGCGIYRGNVFYQRHGLSAVFRALSEKVPTLEELNLPRVCKGAANYPNGLVLVTGPTGSGKSTTLAAMINHINTNHRKHILTLEDPIEFQHSTQRCMVNQRQLHTHFTSFSDALKSALREDPDVILVGEMRDAETMELAITAAETGHLVFATLHTNSASKTIDRLLDSFTADAQPQIRSMLSESLRVVISQKLIPKADRSGRVAIHDILVNNTAVANLIREGKTFQIPSAMQTGKKDGMVLMDQALLEMANNGTVNPQEAWEHANDKAAFAAYAPQDVQIVNTQAGGYTQSRAAAPNPTGTTGSAPSVQQQPTGTRRPPVPITGIKKHSA